MTQIRKRGGRATQSRRAVLQVLTSATHLSAGEIHSRLAGAGQPMDLSTVHRVLAALTDAAGVHAVPVNGVTTYGMADHAHHHTVCISCGVIRQLPPASVAGLVRTVNADGTLTVGADGRGGGVVVYGRCTGGCPEPS